MDLVNITDCSSIAIATSIRPGVPQMFHVRVLETTAAFWAVLRQFLARSHTGSGALGFCLPIGERRKKKEQKEPNGFVSILRIFMEIFPKLTNNMLIYVFLWRYSRK
jgi:hypothetical protein